MEWQKRDKLMSQAMSEGKWSEAINHAKLIPHQINSFEQMPSQNMPASAMHEVVDYFNSLPKNSPQHNNRHSFAFEATHNLPADADSELLHKLYHLSPESYINTKQIISHPNFKYEGRDKQLKEAQDYHHKYEMQVFPEYFATLKSYFTGKPERIKDHRGQEGISDPHIIPSLKEHAAEIQNHILKDDNIPKKFVGPNREPHIKAYRGVNGTYGKAIRDKVEFNPNERSVRRKTLNIPTSHATSWSLDPEMAGRFMWSRGKIDGQPDGQGVVLSQWVPVKNILHSSMHNSVAGFRSKQMDESEIVLGHPEGKMKVSTADMHFQPDPDFSNYTSQKRPITTDSTPNNYGELLKPVVKKSEELEKGAAKRLFPFNPQQSVMSDQTNRSQTRKWQADIGGKRKNIPPMDSAEKFRALNKLSKRTQTRLAADGGREFLLHRGMSPEEHDDSVIYEKGTVFPGTASSWTPHYSMANGFSGEYRDERGRKAPVVSAWVHENNIHSIPRQYGSLDNDQRDQKALGENDYASEHEVIIEPTEMPLHEMSGKKDFGSNMSKPTDINESINNRYNMKDPHFRKEQLKTRFGKSETFELETIKCEDLQKSVKSKLLPAVTALSMLGSNIGTEQGKSFSQVKANPASVVNINKDSDMDPDLDHIKQIESSMGKNVKHKDVNYGINAGSSAYGAYGLMPVQILDTLHYDKALKHKHPHLAEMNPIADEDKVKNYMKAYPNLETEIVKSHWNRLGKKFEGDTNRMAYAWKNGLTGAMKATDEQIKEHPYVKKFNSLKKLKTLETKVNKSENDSVVEVNKIGTFTGTKNNKEDNSDIIKINYFIKNGQLKDLSNQGHFTHNSFVAGFEKDN